MSIDLSGRLRVAEAADESPAVVAQHRIDGPGATLDMREFQQALWSAPDWPEDPYEDPSAAWTQQLPRTVCLTIDTGTRVLARPFEPGRLCIRSAEHGSEVVGHAGLIAAHRDNWLLKALDAFGLSGVAFEMESLRPGLLSAGLGGSATAMTAVCLLANRLAGDPMDGYQVVALAARLENDLGNSLTGTQEQSNVVWGGVRDYVWLPWGVPGEPRQGLGTSLQYELLGPEVYEDVRAHMMIVHTGTTRFSADVNQEWVNTLQREDAFPELKHLPGWAYEYREGLRTADWVRVGASLRGFREIRERLIPAYMAGAEALAEFVRLAGGEAFPLGAGGGGSCLVVAPDPAVLSIVREGLAEGLREIEFELLERGHRFEHC